MKFNYQTFKGLVTILTLVFLISCTDENNNHKFLVAAGNNKVTAHKIKFNSDYLSPLYEIEFKCVNPVNYSQDSLELISFKLIEINDYEHLKLIREKNISKLQDFRLEEKNQLIHTIKFPRDSKSRQSSRKTRKNGCNSAFNELIRIEYNLDATNNQNHVKILGYSNSLSTSSKIFDWEYFLSDKENIYNMYTKSFIKCNHKWNLKLNI